MLTPLEKPRGVISLPSSAAKHAGNAEGQQVEGEPLPRGIQCAGKGDVFRAYAAATRFARNGECDKAVPLARLVAGAVPQFVHAYEPWALCLVRDRNRQGAIDLYADWLRNSRPVPCRARPGERPPPSSQTGAGASRSAEL